VISSLPSTTAGVLAASEPEIPATLVGRIVVVCGASVVSVVVGGSVVVVRKPK